MNAKTCKRIRKEALSRVPNRRVSYVQLKNSRNLFNFGTIMHKPGTFKYFVNQMKKEAE